ncbi:MAG: hypothetical protein KDI79_00460 [Anaerolineae bacterium]|nr:hypothetical protein [Anaerolineae bacterium]
MNKSMIRWLVPGLLVLWLFFVLGSFFAVQKPFAAENVAAIVSALLDLLVAVWLLAISLGLGSWLLERLVGDAFSFGETVVLGTGLGLGLLGLLSFGLGLVGLFHPLAAYAVTVGLSLVAAPQLWRLFRQIGTGRLTNPPHRLVVIYLTITGLLALSVALLPPSDWDGLFYHLTAPKLYLEAGRIVSGIDVPHFSFPSLMEMLFAWAMLLRGDIAAKLLHFSFAPLLAGLVYLTAQCFLSQKSTWPAVVILASMPMLGTLAGWAYNDLALAFYQLASLYAALCFLSPTINHQPSAVSARHSAISGQQLSIINHQLSIVILSAVFAGLAMGLKYTSFVTPVVIGLLLLWNAVRPTPYTLSSTSHVPRSMLYALTPFLLFCLIALLVASPWYLRNWFFTGNPVYPFLYGRFGGSFWDSFRAEWYAAAGTGIGWRPSTLLGLPWLLTLGVRDANYWDGRTGPLLLLFLPLVIGWAFVRRHDRPTALNALLVYTAAHFAFWTLGVIWSGALWQSRLLLPGLVGLAPVAGWVWSELPRLDMPQFSFSRFVNIAVVLTLALTVIDVGLLTMKIDPLPYLAGLESRDTYLTRRLGAYYAAMQQLNTDLPSESTVVFLWEPRSYYCRLDCRPDSILDTFPHLVYQYRTAEAIAQSWHDAGVTNVLIHRNGLQFVLNDRPETIDTEVLSALEENYLQPVFEVAGAYQVFALEFESGNSLRASD